jgi:hypothetical protein
MNIITKDNIEIIEMNTKHNVYDNTNVEPWIHICMECKYKTAHYIKVKNQFDLFICKKCWKTNTTTLKNKKRFIEECIQNINSNIIIYSKV